ncbi:hypothetical protein ES708_09113 [subsurface metagenome]
MARPQKQTVDYFPHDANASEGDTLTILQSRFGNDGYAFWFKLLEKVSSSENHVIDCRNPIKWQLLLAKTLTNEEQGAAIMDLLCDLEAIDAQLWHERKIIWCQKLVNNIADVYKNRNRPVPERPVSTPNNQVSSKKTPVSSPDNTQSKVKETIVNNCTAILKLWNSLEIIKHKKLTADIKRAIDRALRDYSLEVVSQAIKNYAEILKGDQYYFKYSWTLKDFLKRGLDKFLDLEIAKRNYGGDRDGTHRGHPTKLPPRDKYSKPRPNPKLAKLVEQQRATDSGSGRDEPR